MLELLFGNERNFVDAFSVLVATIVYLPLVVATVGAGITWFVTRGEAVKYPMLEWSLIVVFGRLRDKHHHDGFIALCFMAVFSPLIAAPVGLLLYHTPVYAYISIGAVLGLLFVARFVYTLKSKFDSHIKDLHKKAKPEDYDAKW